MAATGFYATTGGWFARIARAIGVPLRERVGGDKFGNAYYVVKKRADTSSLPLRDGGISWHDLRKKEERHVDWANGGSRDGEYSSESLPTEWSQWLNFRRPEPPLSELGADAPHARLEVHEAARLESATAVAGGAQLAPPPAPAPAAVPPLPPAATLRPTPSSAVAAIREGGYKPGGWAPVADAAAISGAARKRRR
ncbi:hypothetical protein T492DRAFT_1081411 [Pavlovales sp. CCMP2436]|nr:hypothetical protein T492DRAFT_1081411 [Pavlovales sp. CCMP2436]